MRQRVDGLLIEDNRILLIQDFSADHRYLPGGGVEPGETNHQALIREWKEECDATITVGEQIVSYENTNSVHGYLQKTTTYAVDLDGKLSLSDELMGMKWFTKEKIEKGTYIFPSAFLEKVLPILY